MSTSVCVIMPVVRYGSRGESVRTLQENLNLKLQRSPNLDVDGIFGPLTKHAVENLQQQENLVVDGIVGSCTWGVLLDREEYNILHRVRMIPQKDGNACWLAAVSMLLGRSDQIERSTVPSSLYGAGGGIYNDSDVTDPVHIRKLAQIFGLRMHHPTSWTARGLADILQYGPVATHILWNATTYVNGTGSSGHFAIIAGIRGDGTESGTTVCIYDPLPVNVGRIRWFNYARLMQGNPALTYHLLQR